MVASGCCCNGVGDQCGTDDEWWRWPMGVVVVVVVDLRVNGH